MLIARFLRVARILQMVSAGGRAGGDSSESHGDTDVAGEEPDSPPAPRRYVLPGGGKSTIRPHSELLNQILIDKFKVSVNYTFESSRCGNSDPALILGFAQFVKVRICTYKQRRPRVYLSVSRAFSFTKMSVYL